MRFDFMGLCISDSPGVHVSHAPAYVFVSYIIAAVGAYAALNLVAWRRHCPGGTERFWHLAASGTLGGSIWAMHFMGMLGVRTDLPIGFEPRATLLSLVIAIAMVGLSLQIGLAGRRSAARIGSAGVLLGCGVVAMHYVGMAALQLPGTVTYTPGLWGVSVLVALGAGVGALWLSLTPNSGWRRVLAVVTMAVAICGMHYTGMAATVIHADPLMSAPDGVAPGPIGVAVAGTTLALLLLALVGVRADRRISEAQARETAAQRLANAELKATQREVVTRLCAAGEFRDTETGAHVTRMAHVAYRLAVVLGYGMEFAEQLLVAAPLHDIGKIAIADSILFKPGPLSEDERALMREHATLGARILGGSDLPVLKLAAEIAQSHHEKWDGSGYPHGLAAREIPLSSRIVAVADVFDALLAHRPYKPAWSVDRVTAHMKEQAGKHFDPSIVDALIGNMPEILGTWLRYAEPTPGAVVAGSSEGRGAAETISYSNDMRRACLTA